MAAAAIATGLKRLRIGLLSAWASRLGGGVFEAVVGQARLIADLGMTPVVFALEDRHSAADRARFGATEVRTLPVRGPAAVGYAPAMMRALLDAKLDRLHLHGIWMYPSLAGARWAERTGRPYLVSPHGMLDPWITARGRAKKAIARIGYERRSWRAASLFHALTAAERGDIARETGRDQIAVVPNPIAPAPSPAAAPADRRGILSLGRIHPKKNIGGLVQGWRRSAAAAAGWRLVIAGWGEPDHVAALEADLAGLGDPSIAFVGPLFGADKQAALAGTGFLALPSFSEGLPMAILEAWAAGTPTIMSAGCNLPEGFAAGAAIDSGTDPADIARAIDRAVALAPERYRAMAAAAAGLAAERFSPAAVAARWTEIYAGAGR